MSRFAKLLAANGIVTAITATGLGAALSLSASASAEPALPPAIPDVPALNALQQLAASPAGMGAILQTAATALNGASQVVSPSQTLPVSPIDVTGTAPLSPALSPAAIPSAPPASSLLGPASGLLPLLNQIGIPANLINLAPAATPVAPIAPAAVPVAPVAPAVAPVIPAAPAVPLLPAGGLLNALP